MAGFGDFALLLAVASAAWSLLAAGWSIRERRADLAGSARGGLLAAALSLGAAMLALLILLLSKDFSVVYVVEYTSRSMSTLYTVGAFWAGQQGSLLLWAGLAALCGLVVVRRAGRPASGLSGPDPTPLSYVVASLAAVVLLFAALVAFTANPFDRLPTAMPDGQGLNPLLRNYGQLVHPLTLYLGMVGLTVPFAYAVAGLAAGLPDDDWLVPAHRWTVFSWIFLTTGIVLGMQWSYVELGWGGYWAWDPVENASLLPWLTATAFLHSAPLQRYRGRFRVWNPALVFTTFVLSLLGTFLTRSGVVSSVHAFSDSALGPFLLGGILIAVLGCGALVVWRLPELRGGARIPGLWSGDGTVAVGNALLVTAAGVVLWGTLYPLTSKATRGVEASVGPTYYLTTVTPLLLGVLVALGLNPVLRGRPGTAGGLPPALLRAGGFGLAVLAVAAILDHGRHAVVDLLAAVSAFTAFAVAEPAVRAARTRLRNRSVPGSAPGGWDRHRYGAALVHVGTAVFIAAVAMNIGLHHVTKTTVEIGGSARVGDYTVRLDDLTTVDHSSGRVTTATLSVTDASGRRLGTLTTSQLTTATQPQPVTDVGIRTTLTEDLYLALEGVETSGRGATIGVYVNPAVLWVWVGTAAVIAGAVLAAWPRRRSRAEPARRRTPGSARDANGAAETVDALAGRS
jgi:cytochrome c-type biogenesis protein CcmF